jgi:hypothetical protein
VLPQEIEFGGQVAGRPGPAEAETETEAEAEAGTGSRASSCGVKLESVISGIWVGALIGSKAGQAVGEADAKSEGEWPGLLTRERRMDG